MQWQMQYMISNTKQCNVMRKATCKQCNVMRKAIQCNDKSIALQCTWHLAKMLLSGFPKWFSLWVCIVSNLLFELQNIDSWHLVCVYLWNWFCAKYRQRLICLRVPMSQPRYWLPPPCFLSWLLFVFTHYSSLMYKHSGMWTILPIGKAICSDFTWHGIIW